MPTSYYGQLELDQVVLGTDGGVGVITTGNPLPAATGVANPADVATDGGRARAREGVLVSVASGIMGWIAYIYCVEVLQQDWPVVRAETSA